MEKIQRQLFLGFIKIHILYHASREPVYGVWLMDELARHGYRVSPGTIYPVLHSLEKQGYLESRRQTVNGKVRKYYEITSTGEEALSVARSRARELVDEIFDQRTARKTKKIQRGAAG